MVTYYSVYILLHTSHTLSVTELSPIPIPAAHLSTAHTLASRAAAHQAAAAAAQPLLSRKSWLIPSPSNLVLSALEHVGFTCSRALPKIYIERVSLTLLYTLETSGGSSSCPGAGIETTSLHRGATLASERIRFANIGGNVARAVLYSTPPRAHRYVPAAILSPSFTAPRCNTHRGLMKNGNSYLFWGAVYSSGAFHCRRSKRAASSVVLLPVAARKSHGWCGI